MQHWRDKVVLPHYHDVSLPEVLWAFEKWNCFDLVWHGLRHPWHRKKTRIPRNSETSQPADGQIDLGSHQGHGSGRVPARFFPQRLNEPNAFRFSCLKHLKPTGYRNNLAMLSWTLAATLGCPHSSSSWCDWPTKIQTVLFAAVAKRCSTATHEGHQTQLSFTTIPTKRALTMSGMLVTSPLLARADKPFRSFGAICHGLPPEERHIVTNPTSICYGNLDRETTHTGHQLAFK